MRRVLARIAAGLGVLVLLAACAAVGLWTLAQRKIEARMRAPMLERQPEAASDLVYRTLDGQVEHLSAAKGHVVFLNLWGTWCIQCVAEMPAVQRLYDHYRGDPSVQFLVVSRLDSPGAVRAYARRHNFTLPFYVTQDADIPSSMLANQFPATFVFAKDGSLVTKHYGAADWSDASVVQFLDGLKGER